MFTHLAFLQTPVAAAGEPAGLAPQLEQPLENSEFSLLLPLIESHVLTRTDDGPGTGPAAHELLAGLLQGGKGLPLSGANLPLAAAPQGRPQLVRLTMAQGQPDSEAVVFEAPMSRPAASLREGTFVGAATEPLLERPLPPQLAIALNNARAQQPMAMEMPREPLMDAGELGLDTTVVRERSTSARPSLPVPTLTLSVDKPNWQPALGERLVWMVSHAQQRAEIKLDPPQLGRVDVQIVMQGERAQLAFAAETLQSRELIEQSLPRLRDMMADAGIDLTDVNIADRERRSAQHEHDHAADMGDSEQHPQTVDGHSAASAIMASGTVLLDLFV